MSEEFPILTAPQIEQQLRSLSRQIGEAQKENANIEMSFSTNKAELEIAMAKKRLELGKVSRPDGKNFTETQKDDEALVANEDLWRAVAIDEARVKASRGRINMLSTQTDIARSVSTSVRTSMAVETGRG